MTSQTVSFDRGEAAWVGVRFDFPKCSSTLNLGSITKRNPAIKTILSMS